MLNVVTVCVGKSRTKHKSLQSNVLHSLNSNYWNEQNNNTLGLVWILLIQKNEILKIQMDIPDVNHKWKQ